MKRLVLVALTIAFVACSGSTGPGTPVSIAGSWSSDMMTLSLKQSGDTVTGNANWGQTGLYVHGTYDRPNVSLTLLNSWEAGLSFQATGTAVGNAMVLTIEGSTSTLHRQ